LEVPGSFFAECKRCHSLFTTDSELNSGPRLREPHSGAIFTGGRKTLQDTEIGHTGKKSFQSAIISAIGGGVRLQDPLALLFAIVVFLPVGFDLETTDRDGLELEKTLALRDGRISKDGRKIVASQLHKSECSARECQQEPDDSESF
jgi:hypothetical protein